MYVLWGGAHRKGKYIFNIMAPCSRERHCRGLWRDLLYTRPVGWRRCNSISCPLLTFLHFTMKRCCTYFVHVLVFLTVVMQKCCVHYVCYLKNLKCQSWCSSWWLFGVIVRKTLFISVIYVMLISQIMTRWWLLSAESENKYHLSFTRWSLLWIHLFGGLKLPANIQNIITHTKYIITLLLCKIK